MLRTASRSTFSPLTTIMCKISILKAPPPPRRAAELWHVALKFPLKMREDETHQTSQEDASDKSSFFCSSKHILFT